VVTFPRKILVATTNPGKVREMRELLSELPVELVSLADFPEIKTPPENGATFAENARRKALYYADHTGLWALADDSGLEVDALEGEPGIHSARYAGPNADDARNNEKLIAALSGLPESERTARFRCAAALAKPGHVLLETEGYVAGRIIDEPRGSNGFGYDPHFLLPARGVTVAELPPEDKNRISHRGVAMARMKRGIEGLR